MITTKAQEREALEKIRKIVEELGENSYVGMAMEGVFELAETNIENDFGFTMTAEAEEKLKRADKKLSEAFEKHQEAEKLMLKAQELEKKFNSNRDYWEDIRKTLDWAAYQLSDKLGY